MRSDTSRWGYGRTELQNCRGGGKWGSKSSGSLAMLVSWFGGKAAKCLPGPQGPFPPCRSQEKKAESEKGHQWGASERIQSLSCCLSWGHHHAGTYSFPIREDGLFSGAGPANTNTSYSNLKKKPKECQPNAGSTETVIPAPSPCPCSQPVRLCVSPQQHPQRAEVPPWDSGASWDPAGCGRTLPRGCSWSPSTIFLAAAGVGGFWQPGSAPAATLV